MHKKSTAQRNWLKPGEHVKDGDVVVIETEGEADVSPQFGERTVIKLKCGDESYDWSINQTSINNLIDSYGDDSAGWVGKKAKAFVIKQRVSQKLTNVLYLAGPGMKMDDDGRFVRSDDYPTPESEGLSPDDIPFE